MPAQYTTNYSPDIRAGCGQVIISAIDAHPTNPGYMAIYNASDVMLSRVNFTRPCGTVNSTTGVTTLTANGRDNGALAAGTASTLRIFDGYGTEKRSLPCEVGVTAVVGKNIMPTLSIAQGQPVEYSSVLI